MNNQGGTLTKAHNELSNCLRIFERDRTPDRTGRHDRIRKLLKEIEALKQAGEL